MNFRDCNLKEPILKALAEQGYTTPTAIQSGAIPPALEGRDVLGCARTGTGKTCAFATPILQRLSETPVEGRPIRALVLTPTRELAIQNQECFEAYGKYLPLNSLVIFGGVGQQAQVDALKAGTDILVATPGRLADLHDQGYIDLSKLEIFVLDEADRMLDMGFIHDVRKILKWLPKKKQTLFFSATMPPEITDLVANLLHHPVRVAVDPVNTTVDAIAQTVYKVDRSNKSRLLIHLLQDQNLTSVLVFTRTKHGANKVSRDLAKKGIPSAAIHGNKSQTARQEALAGFKAGTIRVLVATDIAARGLDIENLACVVNYNLPEVPETYVHRIGRTGRAGKDGIAISLCDYNELPLLSEIEKLIGKKVPEMTNHPFPMVDLTPAVRDKNGRLRNAEDEEARVAAREVAKARQEQKAQGKDTDPHEAKGKQRKKQAEPADRVSEKAPAKAAGKAPEKAEKAVPLNSERKKRKKKPSQPVYEEGVGVVPIPDLLPERKEEPPALEQKFDSKDIFHRTYKRPERKVIPSLASVSLLPTIELKESFGTGLRLDSDLSATPREDSTKRMFSTRKEIPEKFRAAPGRKKAAISATGEKSEGLSRAERRKNRKGSKSMTQAAQTPAKPQPDKKNLSKKSTKKAQKNPKTAPVVKTEKPSKETTAEGLKAATSRQPEKKVSRRNRPPRRVEPAAPQDRQKDSTEQKSLMKPYYLSDLEK